METNLISPWLIKDFIYEECIVRNEIFINFVRMLSMCRAKSPKILSIVQDELKACIREAYKEFIETHKSLNTAPNVADNDRIVDYFFDRIKRDIEEYSDSFNNKQGK